jgi:hypothetical protein
MKTFEFDVIEYFKLQNDQFGLVGTMKPDTFPIITKDYKVKLVTKTGRKYIFKDIGEEIFVRSEFCKNNKRAFRTTDNIEEYLKDLVNDPVKIVGYKPEK